MDAKELILKLKVLLGMAEVPAPATEEAPVEKTETELAAAEAPVETPAETAPVETTPVENEAPAETELEAAEQPAEPATPAEPETNPLEKRIDDLESKIDELYGVIQTLVEKQLEAKEELPSTTATPAQFAAQEEVKPMTRTDRVLALKNLMKD